MLYDFVLELYLTLLKAFNGSLPVGASTADGLLSTITSVAGNLFYYVDVSPMSIFLGLVAQIFIGFVVFKMAMFVYRLIPGIGG